MMHKDMYICLNSAVKFGQRHVTTLGGQARASRLADGALIWDVTVCNSLCCLHCLRSHTCLSVAAAAVSRACAAAKTASAPRSPHPAGAPASVHGVARAAPARAPTPSLRPGRCRCLWRPRAACAAPTSQCAPQASAAASSASGGWLLACCACCCSYARVALCWLVLPCFTLLTPDPLLLLLRMLLLLQRG